MLTFLDTYQGHGPLTEWMAKRYDRIILKLYDPKNSTWTKDSIALCRRIGKPFDVYSTGGGPHEPPATWTETKRILDALGLDPQGQAIGNDWFEFCVGGGMSREDAGKTVEQGVNEAHADNCKMGGYGAVLNAWPVFDHLHIPFDWDWVADPQKPPRRRCDLHQMVIGGQDTDFTDLTMAQWEALTAGPLHQGGDDMTDNEIAQALGFADAGSAKQRFAWMKGADDATAGVYHLPTDPKEAADYQRGHEFVIMALEAGLPAGTKFSAVVA